MFLWLAVCCFCIMYDASWSLNNWADDYQFVQQSSVGRIPHGGTWSGRFFPFAFADYGILLLFFPHGIPASAHFVFNCITLIASIILMFELLRRISSYKDALFGIALLGCAAGFMQIQMYCIYSERLELLTIALFLFGYRHIKKTDSLLGYVLMFLIIAFTTYTKETFFIIPTVIALTELIFDSNLKQKRERVFLYALLVNTFIFLSIYSVRRFYRNPTDDPYASVQINFESISAFFTNEPIMILILILGAVRAYQFIIRKDRSQILWDGALFAACAHMWVFPLMRLTGAYYGFPSIVLCIPAFVLFIRDKTIWLPLVILAAIAWHNIPAQIADTNFALIGRPRTVKLCNAVRDYANKNSKIYWLFDDDTPPDRHIYRLVKKFVNHYAGYPIDIIRVKEHLIKDDEVILCDRKTSPMRIPLLENSNLTKLTEVHGICIFVSKSR